MLQMRREGAPQDRKPVYQLHFCWGEEVPPGPSPAAGCLDTRREADNLAYLKPYATNIPAYRRIIPKGTW